MLKTFGIGEVSPPSDVYKRGRWSSGRGISYYTLVLTQHIREMILYLALILTSICSSLCGPLPQQSNEAKQILYYPERQQFRPQLQYDLSLLEPQFQLPTYNLAGGKQNFPRIQPQIILYAGGASAPGQPFLLQPGTPPGNFLLPQGPNVIIRDSPTPTRPVFVAGYPKPAHIPPIEKDAEEVPTNPSKIPPLKPNEKKPEKLETFNEDDSATKKQPTEADVLAEADRNPAFNPKFNIRPGTSFFILNGQSLYPQNPYNQFNPNIKFNKNILPYQNVLFRSAPEYPENLVLLNQPETYQENNANLNEKEEDDAVVIDAREIPDELEDNNNNNEEKEADVVEAAVKSNEPTISQAQPGAIALAGPGGVAAAAPRGTAFVGKDGLAVSNPQATAIAGPSRDEIVQDNKKLKKTK